MKQAYDKIRILNKHHWVSENHIQRMTTQKWKLILLNNDDQLTFHGRVRKLVARKIGYGVVEVFKAEAIKPSTS